MKCVGVGGGWWLKRRDGKVCPSPVVCFANESRCRDGNGLSVRIRGGGRKKEKEGREVKGIYCQEPSISGNGYA